MTKGRTAGDLAVGDVWWPVGEGHLTLIVRSIEPARQRVVIDRDTMTTAMVDAVEVVSSQSRYLGEGEHRDEWPRTDVLPTVLPIGGY